MGYSPWGLKEGGTTEHAHTTQSHIERKAVRKKCFAIRPMRRESWFPAEGIRGAFLEEEALELGIFLVGHLE